MSVVPERGQDVTNGSFRLPGQGAPGWIVGDLFTGESAHDAADEGDAGVVLDTGRREAADEDAERDAMTLRAGLEAGNRPLEHEVIPRRVDSNRPQICR